jgi:hypothetical protein
MRRSTVLSLPLQSVFPGVSNEVYRELLHSGILCPYSQMLD